MDARNPQLPTDPSGRIYRAGVGKRGTVVLAGGLIPAGRQLLPDYGRVPREQSPMSPGGALLRLSDFHDRSLSRGQKLSWRASEERGCKFFSGSSPRVLASQPWFLFQIEPDFHLLPQTSEWS